MAKKKARKTKRKATSRVISLKTTVAELHRATKKLSKVRDRTEGPKREELNLKLESLEKIDKELQDICHGYLLWPIPNGQS